jgi:hypothetical protein
VSKSTPAAPDYTQAAEQQGYQTQALNAQQTANNRPDVNTPWGTLTYTDTPGGIDPATGTEVDQWNENVSLSPAEQAAVNSQQAIQQGTSGIAQNLLNQVGTQIQQPNTAAPQESQLTGAGQGIDYNPQAEDMQAQNAVWNQFENLEEPLQQQQTQGEQAQLAAQGLKPGDAAYNTAMQNLSNTQSTQTQNAQDQAVLAGEQEGSTLFNEGNAAQAQGFGQDTTQTGYNNSLIGSNIQNQQAETGLNQEQAGYDLNLMNAALNGQQVGMPSFPGTTSSGSGQAANLLNAAENQGQADLNSYNASASNTNSEIGAGVGILAAAASAY